ncbi:unnamed protein product [Chrysoparadoxa australica]
MPVLTGSNAGAEKEKMMDAESAVEVLTKKLLQLRHAIVVRSLLAPSYSQALQDHLSDPPEELLAHLLVKTATDAARAATTTKGANGSDCEGGGTMAEFRKAAGAANKAALQIGEQCSFDAHDLEQLRRKLMHNWMYQVERTQGNSIGRSDELLGESIPDSAFEADAYESRVAGDMFAALQVAFVSTVTSSYEEDGASDAIVSMDLKNNVGYLLSVANDTNERTSRRTRLRALCAAGVIAPQHVVKDVYNQATKGMPGAPSLQCFSRHMAYMVEVEEVGLPHRLPAVLAVGKEDLVRALWRDYRDEGRLLPLLCEMLLDCGSTDSQLWRSLLYQMVTRLRLHRAVLLRILPRLSHSPVVHSTRQHGSDLAGIWEEVLKKPVEELLQREGRRVKAQGLMAAPQELPPPPTSSLSFSASLFYAEKAAEATGTPQASENKDGGADDYEGNSALVGDLPEEKVWPVIDQVLYLLGCCPFPDLIDVEWFAPSLLQLGDSFQPHAIRAALAIPLPSARINAIREAYSKHKVPLTVILKEASGTGIRGSTGSTLDGIYDFIQEEGLYMEVRSTPYFNGLVRYLVEGHKADGLVDMCIKSGKTSEAAQLAKLHYTLHPLDGDVESRDEVTSEGQAQQLQPRHMLTRQLLLLPTSAQKGHLAAFCKDFGLHGA